jgi:tetratricopeptide (TPR) repeat protein
VARLAKGLIAVLLIALAGGTIWWTTRSSAQALLPTVADLEAVHSEVTTPAGAVRGAARLTAGDFVHTDADGRARIRLDDGTSAIVDRETKLTLRDAGMTLEAGRLFVMAASDARAEISIGSAKVLVTAANAGFQKQPDGAEIYAANAELVVSVAGHEHKLRAGEAATLRGDRVTVAPAKTFDDWTGGLAAPWGAGGVPRRAVGELWGRPLGAPAGDPGSPLTIRSHDVTATIRGELAETKLRSVYFNGGSTSVAGDFRLALPVGAIVSRFAWGSAEPLDEASIVLANREQSALRPTAAVLEWAGEGWLRGNLPGIASGATAIVELEYVEWLDPKLSASGSMAVQYRYPMAAAAEPPLIGEFSARVDASPSRPIAIASGFGARAERGVVQIRRPDFRPSADLVVDVELPAFESNARSYLAPADGDDERPTIMVRSELPEAAAEAGATIVFLVDSSGSAEPGLLDISRAFVGAVLDALGSRDRVLVLAADQSSRVVGPETIGPVDDARRQQIKAALAKLEPGGATDLGRALEAGADALPADAPSGIVVYVGDGWPTVGDATFQSMQARLARRAAGTPRLAAVAVGPLSNRAALAALTRGSGPLLEIADAIDSGGAAASLVAEALRPTLAAVELDLGPDVEQIYPRHARSIVAGQTVTVVGRLRGRTPSAAVLRYRTPSGEQSERRPLSLRTTSNADDVRRRWARARVEDVVMTGKGQEAAIDVALRAGLVTPWTALSTQAGPYVASVIEARLLDLSSRHSGVSAAFSTPSQPFGALTNVPLELPSESIDEIKLEPALAAAAVRALEAASDNVRACRDSRAALRPHLSGRLRVVFQLDGEGRARDVRVRGETAEADDAALDRCVEVVVSGLRYPRPGAQVRVRVEHLIELPPPRATQPARCSQTSMLPLPLRRGIWLERLRREQAGDAALEYMAARRSCEAPTWGARRALLELMLTTLEGGPARVALARRLELAGEPDAANFVRREAVRRARTPEELRSVRRALLGDERYPIATFRKRYLALNGDAARLELVRQFLLLAPHDASLRRRALALLEALGKKQELGEEIRKIRLDPFADAELLAESASALRRIGREQEARRTFGELAERAPSDPWARAFLGDRLRNEGWFDDAVAAYAALDQILPDNPGALVRMALAHAGAGRVDIARRLLARVAQTGGREGNAALADLATRLAAVLLAEAAQGKQVSKEDVARLSAALLESSRSTRGVSVVVLAPAGDVPLGMLVVRGTGADREERPAEIRAEGAGVYALSFDPQGSAGVRVRLSRPAALPPARPTRVRVSALIANGPETAPRLSSIEVELPASGKPLELEWRADRFVN